MDWTVDWTMDWSFWVLSLIFSYRLPCMHISKKISLFLTGVNTSSDVINIREVGVKEKFIWSSPVQVLVRASTLALTRLSKQEIRMYSFYRDTTKPGLWTGPWTCRTQH